MAAKKVQNPTYSSVEELAADLGISRPIAYRALKAGKIPHIRIGKRIIVPRQAVEEWLRTAGGSLKDLGA